MKIPDLIQTELDACGLPYRIEEGTKHNKIYVNEIFCGILPKCRFFDGRAVLNIRSQIRRAVKGMNEWTKKH